MIWYAYFANSIMVILLSMAVFAYLDMRQLCARLLQFQWQSYDSVRLGNQAHEPEQTVVINYHKLLITKNAVTIQYALSHLFSPYVNSVTSLKGMAPAFGLLFTVVSIILSFSEFSDSGDVQAMFGIAAIGFSTTALGTAVVILCRFTTDKLLIPTLWIFERGLYRHRQLLKEIKHRDKTPLFNKGAEHD